MTQAIPTPKVLIIVPAYKEEDNINGVIQGLYAQCSEWDILVINDGSPDGTSERARQSGLATVIDLPVNLGIGGGVQTGFKYAHRYQYDVAIQFDGDGQHRADQIQSIIDPVLQAKFDMVIGSRFINPPDGFQSTVLRRFGINIFKFVNSLLIQQTITDNTSGFRAYSPKALEFLSCHYPTDYPEPEAVILLGKNNFLIHEVPVLMEARQGGVSSISGLGSLYYMVKVLLAIFMSAIRRPVRG